MFSNVFISISIFPDSWTFMFLLLVNCDGWLQICLSPVSSFMIRPRRAIPLLVLICAMVSSTSAWYRPACSRLSATGWFGAEHAAYGVPFPEKRFGPLTEQLEIITGMWGTRTGETFDSSWEKGAPAVFTIDDANLIPGFVDAVVGQPIGSQVVVSIPQELGYDDPATRPATIGEGEHLLFVIDILDRLEPAAE